MEAAKHVEKVRINPGNFVDKRATFQTLVYTDEEYGEELRRLREKFTAFLDVCREHGTAVRIGTNHGSATGIRLPEWWRRRWSTCACVVTKSLITW